jgi:hypothetical protein
LTFGSEFKLAESENNLLPLRNGRVAIANRATDDVFSTRFSWIGHNLLFDVGEDA